MFKFIHIGDVHLDTTFYSRDQEIRERLRSSLRQSFLEVIETCIAEKVNALLIAGDLFDNSQLSFQTEDMLINSFRRLKDYNIKVFYATGNHDPGQEDQRGNYFKWPENVFLFSNDQITSIEVLGEDDRPLAVIVGVGHGTSKESRNLIKDFPCKTRDLPYVGLAHTMVTSANGVEKHQRYLPCSKEDLEGKGYDYWALGHIHKMQPIGEEKRIYYSGNLQGRHPKENGRKGGLLVTLHPHHLPQVEFIPFSKIVWETVTVENLENIKNYIELREHLGEEITKALKEEDRQRKVDLLRIELKGRSDIKEEIQQEENLRQLELDLKYHFNLMGCEIKVEELMPNQDLELYIEGENVLSKTLKLLEGLQREEVLLQRILNMNFATKGLKNNEDKIQYISQLKSGLQEESVKRMVGGVK